MTFPRQTTRHAAPVSTAPYATFDLLVERLHGSDEHLRSAALHELGGLADSTAELRPAVTGVVCDFLRSPWTLHAGVENEQTALRVPGRQRGRHGRRPVLRQSQGLDPTEPELRRAAVRLLADHLRRPEAPTTWAGTDLDLAGAVLVGADFSGCCFPGGTVRFEGAWCIEGRMSFAGARFEGASVSFRHWTSGQGRLGFENAAFLAGSVSLAGASLDGDCVSLAGCVVEGGVLAFTEATLRSGVIDLTGIRVSSGTLSFADAALTGGRLLLVDAQLLGGVTSLRDARLAGQVLSIAGSRVRPAAVDLRGLQVEDEQEALALHEWAACQG